MSPEKPARNGFVLVPCDGSSHENPHIDNCGMCAPRWGWVEVHAATLAYAARMVLREGIVSTSAAEFADRIEDKLSRMARGEAGAVSR